MKIINSAQQMRDWAHECREQKFSIALVPTMGALHEGHLSLVRAAKEKAQKTIVSIFVNPKQFAPHEDFNLYPRNLQDDLAKLQNLAPDVVFIPEIAELYGNAFDTYVVPEHLQTLLCGKSRPIFFRGVCTVVMLLFRITLCHISLFGEKDYQQLQIIKRMACDLWLDVEVIGMPTVRESDGLAMSSRNAYLNQAERSQALWLFRTLLSLHQSCQAGIRDVTALHTQALQLLSKQPFIRLDYLEILEPSSFMPLQHLDRPAHAFMAAWIGKTRLIDNMALT